MSNILNQKQTKVHKETSGGDECVYYLERWWFHRCRHMSKFIKLYTLNIYRGFFVYQLGPNKAICQKWEGKYLTNGWGGGHPKFVVFASFHDVNIPTMNNVKLLCQALLCIMPSYHWTWKTYIFPLCRPASVHQWMRTFLGTTGEFESELYVGWYWNYIDLDVVMITILWGNALIFVK